MNPSGPQPSRAQVVSGMRGLARSSRGPARASRPSRGDTSAAERCDLCGTTLAEDHRHLLHLSERRILCSCEACWGMRAGDGDLRPVGKRTLWLQDLQLPDHVWAGFQIPIGLAFFMQSTVTSCVVAMYPSPGGATESELRLESWAALTRLNPVLEDLEPDVEGLIVNRLAEPPIYVIAPIDHCYALTGTIKASWEGISGGSQVEQAVTGFFARLRNRAEAVTAQ